MLNNMAGMFGASSGSYCPSVMKRAVGGCHKPGRAALPLSTEVWFAPVWADLLAVNPSEWTNHVRDALLKRWKGRTFEVSNWDFIAMPHKEWVALGSGYMAGC